jgi:hypothetical protein
MLRAAVHLATVLCLLPVSACGPSLAELQSAFMKKAIAECEYETKGADPTSLEYRRCMRAKGAE